MKNFWDDLETFRGENIMNKNYAIATIRNKNYDPRRRLKIFIKKNYHGIYFLSYHDFGKEEDIPLGQTNNFNWTNGFGTIKEAQKALIEWNEYVSQKAELLSDIPDLQHKWKI